MIAWVLTVVAAVAPIGVAAGFYSLLKGEEPADGIWISLTSRGELFLVAAGIGAGAIADVLVGGTKIVGRVVTGSFGGIFVTLNLVAYALVYAALELKAHDKSNVTVPEINVSLVSTASLISLIATIIVAILSRLIAAWRA